MTPDALDLQLTAAPQVLLAVKVVDRPGRSYAMHRLSELEINLIASGRVESILNGRHLVNEAPHAYLYAPGDVVSGMGDASRGVYTCRIARFRMPASKQDKAAVGTPPLPRSVRLSPAVLAEATQVFDAMTAAFASGSHGWQAMAGGYLLALLGLIAREHARIGSSDAADPTERMVARAVAIMERKFRDTVAVGEVAAAVGLSEDHFARTFRARMGLGPARYLIRLRLEEARRLLACGDDRSIVDIAHRCGFGDAKHFTTVFRAHFAITPSRFQRDARWQR